MSGKNQAAPTGGVSSAPQVIGITVLLLERMAEMDSNPRGPSVDLIDWDYGFSAPDPLESWRAGCPELAELWGDPTPYNGYNA